VKLTVIVSQTGEACNVGGPVTYRRITVDLTPEQAAPLALHDRWESYGTTFIELDPSDRVCSCPFGAMERESGVSMRDSEGKCVRCGKAPACGADAKKERDA
jgi:Fe-S-cluster-containing hydrogenase component 2